MHRGQAGTQSSVQHLLLLASRSYPPAQISQHLLRSDTACNLTSLLATLHASYRLGSSVSRTLLAHYLRFHEREENRR
jgi:hypothetical protein